MKILLLLMLLGGLSAFGRPRDRNERDRSGGEV
jgi:hypothetical protein